MRRGGVGPGVAATVNVQVASWSATATALPAWSAESKTTCGQSNVAPLTHGGMSRVIRILRSPASSAPRSFGSRPIPTGSSANGVRVAEQPVAGGLDLADRHALDVVLAVGEQDHRGADGVGGQVLGGLLHGRDVVRVDADLLLEGRVEALPVRRGDGAQAVGELGDGLRAVQEMQVDAARGVDGLAGELDDARRRVAGDEVGRRLVDTVRPCDSSARGEPVAVGLVQEDRRREVEHEHDLGAVGRGGAGGRGEGRRRQQGSDDDGDDDAAGRSEAIHGDPCTTRQRIRFKPGITVLGALAHRLHNREVARPVGRAT